VRRQAAAVVLRTHLSRCAFSAVLALSSSLHSPSRMRTRWFNKIICCCSSCCESSGICWQFLSAADILRTERPKHERAEVTGQCDLFDSLSVANVGCSAENAMLGVEGIDVGKQTDKSPVPTSVPAIQLAGSSIRINSSELCTAGGGVTLGTHGTV